jgi:hypothetical protein
MTEPSDTKLIYAAIEAGLRSRNPLDSVHAAGDILEGDPIGCPGVFVDCAECGLPVSTMTPIYGHIERQPGQFRTVMHREPTHWRRDPCGHALEPTP